MADELTPESLQQKLAAYQKAMQEEFELTHDEINNDSEELAAKARSILASATPNAAATLVYLCDHGESENIRLQASKYLMDNALGKKGFAEPDDPMAALLKKLTGAPSENSSSEA